MARAAAWRPQATASACPGRRAQRPTRLRERRRRPSIAAGMPARLPLDDRTLFGNDAGEDEREDVLVSYFVDQPAFRRFLDAGEPLRVAVGRKGTGKSALLMRFAHDLRADAALPLVLHLVPANLVSLKEPPATDNGVVLENWWKQVLCGAINMELAREIGFAWKDEQIALVESAEVAGFKGKNLVSALLSRLVGKISVGGVVDIVPKPQPAANPEQLLARVQKLSAAPRRVWLLLDDIDTHFQNSPAQRAYVASFFAVCRALPREIAGIGIRATVRTDVFASLGAEHLDKIEQYMTPLTWPAALQKTLLAQRVAAYLRRNEPEAPEAKWSAEAEGDALIELVFARRMKWGGSAAPPAHVLRVLGGGRPRWMMQLSRQAGEAAAGEGAGRIGAMHVQQAMAGFGRRRLADLYNEHGYQFTDLRRLIESFSGGARRYDTAALVAHIESAYLARVTPGAVPAVDGTPYRGALQLAHFLYKCGFVNGNNRDDASMARPEFVTWDARPDLLQVDTNLDDGMAWEIQPAVRRILRVE